MNKLIIPFMLMIAFASGLSASNSSDAGIESETGTTIGSKNKSAPLESLSNPCQYKNLTIRHDAVGPFTLLAHFPRTRKYKGYRLVRQEEIRESEFGQFTVIRYDCMKGGERHMGLYPNMALEEDEEAVIVEIRLYSERYKTDAGMGVGNTIEEFYSSYAEAKAFYMDRIPGYWLEMREFQHVQFMMKEDDYSGKPIVDASFTDLDKSEFKQNAKIETVRFH